MHIPTSTTQEIEILTFHDAKEHRDNSAAYDREKWLYIPDFYSEYRYILGTVGKNPLITIGINPSTAEPDNLDNTLKSVQRIAKHNGFDSFIIYGSDCVPVPPVITSPCFNKTIGRAPLFVNNKSLY